jgi:hypothetical protein
MFYEAHQAQWVDETRPLAALLREPQAQLRPLAGDETDTLSHDLPQLKELPVHRDALTMVRQQLETLETRQIIWQGTLWPGQTIEWQVGEESAQAASGGEEEQAWRSRLKLSLPRLGGIDATLIVTTRGVRISVRAGDADSAAMLDDNRASLHSALAAAGVPPLAIGVAHAA